MPVPVRLPRLARLVLTGAVALSVVAAALGGPSVGSASAAADPGAAGATHALPKQPGVHCVSVPTGVYVDGVQQYRWVCSGLGPGTVKLPH